MKVFIILKLASSCHITIKITSEVDITSLTLIDPLDEEILVGYIKKCFKEKKPLEEGLHDRAMFLFKQYILVGGMPKSVIAFLEGTRDFDSADREKRDILNLYRDDI